MDAFVMVSAGEVWRFDSSAILLEIQRYWPVRRTWPASKTRACQWSIRLSDAEGKMLDGFLAPGCDLIWIDGYEEPCIRFVRWLRQYVPEGVQLVFGDDQHGEVLPLKQETSPEAIIQFIRSE